METDKPATVELKIVCALVALVITLAYVEETISWTGVTAEPRLVTCRSTNVFVMSWPWLRSPSLPTLVVCCQPHVAPSRFLFQTNVVSSAVSRPLAWQERYC